LLPSPLNLIGVAVLTFALIMNMAAVLQYSLQGARQFKPVAFVTAAPAGAFVLLVSLWHLFGLPGFRGLIVLYCASWAGVLIYLWTYVMPLQCSSSVDSSWSLGKTCIMLGWPIVLANGGLSLVQSADRVVVSSALPIYDFAQYCLASSMMFVPVAAIVAVYRVFFSHVAAVAPEGRVKIYARASKFLLLAWSLLLPYFFVLQMFVRYSLPKYVTALPPAGILLLGVIFLAGIQILHMSFAYLYGKQRQLLFLTVGALVVSFSVAVVMAVWLRSLVAVAIGQVVALAFWWFADEWYLRETTGQSWKDWMRIVFVFVWSASSYAVAMKWGENLGLQTLIYYSLVAGCLVFTCYSEIKIAWNLLSRAVSQTIVYGTRG